MVNDFHYNLMNMEHIFLVDMFEAKFKGNVLNKSTGREYCEQVKYFLARKMMFISILGLEGMVFSCLGCMYIC